jgi:ribosomal protein S18 acetylase RimI-like enzyme
MAIIVRSPRSSDIPDMVRLTRLLNESESNPTEFMDDSAFQLALFSDPAPIGGLVAEQRGTVVGLTLFHRSWHMPHAQCELYVSDIFVDSQKQNHGIGRSLMASVAAEAQRQKLTFLWWIVKPINKQALKFYAKIGASSETTIAHALPGYGFFELANEAK